MNIFLRALKVAAQVLVIDHVEGEIARKRMSVCLMCPYRDPKNEVCGICHCFLDLKTTSETNWNPERLRQEITHCPKGKWDDKEIANVYRQMDGKELLT